MPDGNNKKLNIIFVCTGNTCRSPMAEFLFKDYLKRKGRASDFTVSSAGLAVEKGSALSENACAKTFTVAMSLEADLIVAMSDMHAERCGSDNAVSFEELIGSPISDPYGGSTREYIDCAVQMRSAFDTVLDIADERLEEKRKRG